MQPGDVIAVNGFDKLQDGIKVATARGQSRIGEDGGNRRSPGVGSGDIRVGGSGGRP